MWSVASSTSLTLRPAAADEIEGITRTSDVAVVAGRMSLCDVADDRQDEDDNEVVFNAFRLTYTDTTSTVRKPHLIRCPPDYQSA